MSTTMMGVVDSRESIFDYKNLRDTKPNRKSCNCVSDLCRTDDTKNQKIGIIAVSLQDLWLKICTAAVERIMMLAGLLPRDAVSQ
jgi:hypothetical protein